MKLANKMKWIELAVWNENIASCCTMPHIVGRALLYATLDRGAHCVLINKIHKPDVGSMFDHRLRRWPNIDPTLVGGWGVLGRCVALCGVVFFTPCNVRDPSQPEIPHLRYALQIKWKTHPNQYATQLLQRWNIFVYSDVFFYWIWRP